MKLHIYKTSDFYIFSFQEISNLKKLTQAELNLSLEEIIFLIKTCLSELKNVIITNHTNLDFLKLHTENKKFHISRVENSFLYLNFSVRNQLKKITQLNQKINSYNDLDQVFKNFSPHT